MIRGSPGDVVANKYRELKNIAVELSDAADSRPKTDVHELSLQLSVAIREYLLSSKELEKYSDECLWADGVFKRIDDRFSKLTGNDYEQARNFYMQIMLELERRKL